MFKLGTHRKTEGDFYDEVPWTYPNLYCRERTTGADRLVIAPSADYINILLDLSAGWKGEYWLLYVLIVSHCGNEPARYQSPAPIAYDELTEFCQLFETYLCSDGRHHLWIGSTEGSDMLVYDNHNLIYAYGGLDEYEARLVKRGLRAGEVNIPAPHIHFYHSQLATDEERMMKYWNWKQSPLREGDDP